MPVRPRLIGLLCGRVNARHSHCSEFVNNALYEFVMEKPFKSYTCKLSVEVAERGDSKSSVQHRFAFWAFSGSNPQTSQSVLHGLLLQLLRAAWWIQKKQIRMNGSGCIASYAKVSCSTLIGASATPAALFLIACAGSSLLSGLSPDVVSGVTLQSPCTGFSLQWLVVEHRLSALLGSGADSVAMGHRFIYTGAYGIFLDQGTNLCPSEWEKIIASEITDKGLISKIYKQLIQLNARKTTQWKSGEKT